MVSVSTFQSFYNLQILYRSSNRSLSWNFGLHVCVSIFLQSSDSVFRQVSLKLWNSVSLFAFQIFKNLKILVRRFNRSESSKFGLFICVAKRLQSSDQKTMYQQENMYTYHFYKRPVYRKLSNKDTVRLRNYLVQC